MTHLAWTSLPCIVLYAWLAVELVGLLGRRYGGGRDWVRDARRLSGWALRPWAAWAALSLVYRWQWAGGFNNRRTFPFFANLWHSAETWRGALTRLARTPTVWAWGCAVLGVLVVVIVVAVTVVRRPPRRTAGIVALLVVCAVLAVALHLSVACLPEGAGLAEGARGSLLSCWHTHATMLYTVPHVKRDTGYYLDNFLEIQPRLRETIHGLSHPPGASLSLYWIGVAVGADGMDIRTNAARIRYALGLTAFGALNVVLLFLLGRALFGEARVGLLAALLWMSAPSTLAYATFAQDALYAVFFNLSLLLVWQAVTARKGKALWCVLLGLSFFCLTLLNYSWCIVTTIFAVFVLWYGLRAHWPRREYLLRGGVPLAVMAVLLAAFLEHYDLDYLGMYLYSRAYVGEWYKFTGVYQWVAALIGGQLDLWLLLGGVTVTAFVVALVGLRRADLAEPRTMLLLTVLGVYAIPLLIGPTCLKMETARVWNWVASIPLAFAAERLLREQRAGLFAGGAVASSVLVYVGMRLFMNFAP